MSKNHDIPTREHLLLTGEQLSHHKGFNALGLNELLQTAQVPKGSFYHYFRSKEAFGAAMLENHYAGYYQTLHQHFTRGPGNCRDRLLDYFRQALVQFCDNGMISGCLTVKLSAEVCDLSEDMRHQLKRGAEQITDLLASTLQQGIAEGSLHLKGDPAQLACSLYALWLGANLQAKITRQPYALECALAQADQILTR